MTGWLVAIFAGVSVVAVIFAGVQGSELASTTAELESVNGRLSASQASLKVAVKSRVDAEAALKGERDRAVAAEQLAGELQEQITRDTDTDRDAPTAPVLLNVLKRLGVVP